MASKKTQDTAPDPADEPVETPDLTATVAELQARIAELEALLDDATHARQDLTLENAELRTQLEQIRAEFAAGAAAVQQAVVDAGERGERPLITKATIHVQRDGQTVEIPHSTVIDEADFAEDELAELIAQRHVGEATDAEIDAYLRRISTKDGE